MHISEAFDYGLKADIENQKADIENKKADIQERLANIDKGLANKTIMHVLMLFDKCGKNTIFGRTTVEEVTTGGKNQ